MILDKSKTEDYDDLVVKRKGGGSIIERHPLFSSDGEIVYIIKKRVIRAYSCQTGDFIKEFEPAEHKIIGINFLLNNLHCIIGCTENGDIVHWNFNNGLITKKMKLAVPQDVKLKSFHLIDFTNVRRKLKHIIVVSYFNQKENKICLHLFLKEDGKEYVNYTIEKGGPTYSITIIGNYGNNMIAVGFENDLHIFEPQRYPSRKCYSIGPYRNVTCLEGHPEEECVAVGDTTGRVVVWRNFKQKMPSQATYHWHTLPVVDIAFSKLGGYMYSGGDECVLVKWTLSKPLEKSYLPRLVAPIKYLTVAPDNLYIAISTQDNGITIINPQKTTQCVIQYFTWGDTSKKDLYPAGLTFDPRTGNLVCNSRTGCVQFFDIYENKLIYNINITGQNFLTQLREILIVNTEVTKIALSHDGSWMATAEERDDKVSVVEVRLKFWKYSAETQIYTLNTSIEFPHEHGVNAIRFQPTTSLDGDGFIAVTTGKDHKFKLWDLTESSSKAGKHWQCYGVGSYRNIPTIDAGFSIDGSLLGVSFGSSLTIWQPESNNLKNCLSHSNYPLPIKRVEFGKQQACHLVIVGSNEHIAVWNLMTLNMIWSVPLKLTTLAADLQSLYMAVFTENNSLFVFNPLHSKPIYTRKNILDDNSTILCATFVPHLRKKRISNLKDWQQKSQLYFLDSNQELLTLELESESEMLLDNLTVAGSVPKTAFSNLIAVDTISKVQRSTFLHGDLHISGKGFVDKLLTISAHTLPPMRSFCSSFILSLRSQNEEKVKNQKENQIVEINHLDESDSDDEMKTTAKDTQSNIIKQLDEIDDDETEENSLNLVSYNWNFLKEIF